MCPSLQTRSGLRDNLNMTHGTPVFPGTQVPLAALFEHIANGETLEDFLSGFPAVSRKLALQALKEAKQLLLASASLSKAEQESIRRKVSQGIKDIEAGRYKDYDAEGLRGLAKELVASSAKRLASRSKTG
jgi:uncharacterized protein (DUF433 family)